MNSALNLLDKNKVFVKELNMDMVPLSIAKQALELQIEESGVSKYQDQLEEYFNKISDSINNINSQIKDSI